MRRRTAGLSPLLLLVGVASAFAGQNPPPGADGQKLAGDFAVPVFVIQGAEDFTTPTSLARSFVDSIRAPAKAFVPIEGGGHFAVFMKSSAFLDELVSRVLPLAR